MPQQAHQAPKTIKAPQQALQAPKTIEAPKQAKQAPQKLVPSIGTPHAIKQNANGPKNFGDNNRRSQFSVREGSMWSTTKPRFHLWKDLKLTVQERKNLEALS